MFQKIYSLFLFSFVIVSLNAQMSYTLKGHFPDTSFNKKKVYIQKMDDSRTEFVSLDSIIVNQDEFFYKGIINQDVPSMLFIALPRDGDKKSSKIMFMPEEGEITISVGSRPKVGGTPKNEEIQAFMDLQNSLAEELNRINNRYANMIQTTANQEKKISELEPVANRLKSAVYDFTKSNIKNDIGEYMALSAYSILPPDQLLELLGQTRPQFKESELGQELFNYYEAMIIRDGRGAYKDLKLKTPDGKDMALSDYIGKNKVVLIDFWASWCGPCIKEMPTIVKVYEKYKDKGFEIVGISLDDNKQSWVAAIDRLNITWPQMSDLQGWKSEAVRLYVVNSIPYTLLVDKDGNIIASFVYGDELEDKLKELLD
ncbi:AhpC/TSA family protein [Dysgonomonas sp. OttesenSCG-928-M03]|nr:AhpC/TSA family protein [Dysgonomonas sp. OttesenSCG-928-M03]